MNSRYLTDSWIAPCLDIRADWKPVLVICAQAETGRNNVVHAYAAFPNRVSNDRGLRSTLVEHSRPIAVL